MTDKNEKFIMLHVSSKDSADLLSDAIKVQGAERGLYLKTTLGKEIYNQFDFLKKRGYFPMGIIVNPISENVEFLFFRHPEQKTENKLAEFKQDNPIKL